MSRTKKIPATLSEKSSWTPKNHVPSNEKIYSERMTLIKKWYAAWSEEQRWPLLEHILKHLNDEQLLFIHSLLQPAIPPADQDFTRVLPRFLCLRILSLLDPQSLCRAAQVSWYWKYLTESNEIWREKCLRLGWFLPAPPPPQLRDYSLWKRHYVACVHQLHWNPPQPPHVPDVAECVEESTAADEDRQKKVTKRRVRKHLVSDKPRKPWKDPDPCPKETHFLYGEEISNFPLFSRFPYMRSRMYGMEQQVKPFLSTPLPVQHTPPAPPPPIIPSPTSLLHPTLLEKLRLGSPSTEHIELNTLNRYQTENDVNEAFYKLHTTSPFPKLPPYFVHQQEEEDPFTKEEEALQLDIGKVGTSSVGSTGIYRPTSGKSSASIKTVSSISGTCNSSRVTEVNKSSLQREEKLPSKAWHIPDYEDNEEES